MLTPFNQPMLPLPPPPTQPRPQPGETKAVVVHPNTKASLAAAPSPFQLLEVTIISAQDLSPAARTVATYAVAWVNPAHKLTTRVDHAGRVNPTWNDKFVFRVDEEFLRSDTSAVMIQIYGSCRFRTDPLIGTVRLVLSSLNPSATTSFVALQVRRPSCRPQGILNVGVALLDGYIRSMPLYSTPGASAFAYRDLMGAPQPLEDPGAVDDDDSGRQRGVSVKGEDMLMRSGSLVVKRWGTVDQERNALETKLEQWRTELPPINPVRDLSRLETVDDEIHISNGGVRRRKKRSWSTAALSCFCEVRRQQD